MKRIPTKYIIYVALALLTVLLLAQIVGCNRADLPVSVVSVKKYIDPKGSQQINIIIKNTSSDNTITSAELYVKCYDSKGMLLGNRSSGQSLYNCTYSSISLVSGQLSSEDLYFNYSGFDEISYLEIAVKKIIFSDGNELDNDTDSLDYEKYEIESEDE